MFVTPGKPHLKLLAQVGGTRQANLAWQLGGVVLGENGATLAARGAAQFARRQALVCSAVMRGKCVTLIVVQQPAAVVVARCINAVAVMP